MLKLTIFLVLLELSSVVLAEYNITLVPKLPGKKLYIHLMPWFETKETSGNGQWGMHWTMATKNPDNIVGEDNKREIAAHYYPEIHPYGSGDGALIDYQIQMMKAAGADGVLIDWPGTLQANDYPKNHQNCINFVNRLASSGLEFAVVYEDRNLEFTGDKIGQAQADMNWLQSNWISQPNYIRVNGNPLVLVFGPIQLQSPNEWEQVFSVMNPKPTFLTLWYESQDAGANAAGEYAWIYSDFLDGLANFYNNRPLGTKMGVVYPGFHDFYVEGGWGGSYFHIPHEGTSTMRRTLDLALGSDVPFVQVGTWNDYGEGTMIEPTREFGNQFLNMLASGLKINHGDKEFNTIRDLYLKRKDYEARGLKSAETDKKFEEINELINHLRYAEAAYRLKQL